MSRSLSSYLLISLGCCVLLAPMGAKADSQRLFFCETSNNFYPAVATCAVPWKEVDKGAAAESQPAPHRVIAYPIGMPPPAQNVAPAAAPAVLTPAVATVVAPAPAAELATSQGPVNYVYGAETTPLIVCAVSQLCDMALQPGEKINHIILGDPEHWKIETLEEGGGGDETLHLIIRPSSPDLATSLIVLTKSRSYHVQLQSHRKDYMMQVAFSYPQAQAAAELPPPAAPAAAVESDDGFVKVGGVTYVKGREPKTLGTAHAAEPPPPAADPRPEVTAQPTTP